MKIAVISDIHGNLYALEAVLKDIEGRGIKKVFCAGDLVGYGPRPNEVTELMRNKKIPTVMGNYDDAIGNMRITCGCDYKDEATRILGESSVAWTRENISELNRLWLGQLPSEIRLSAPGTDILLVHGSPGALNEYLYQETPEDYLNGLLLSSQAAVLICGHTHRPYVKSIKAGHVVNAGSVGRPLHGNPNATYVVAELDEGHFKAEIVEVRYDYIKTSGEIEDSGLPLEFARIIRTGIGKIIGL